MAFDLDSSHIGQKIIRIGRDEGLLQGVKDGREQGQLVWIRRHIELMVSKRFPDLVPFMRAQADQTNDLEQISDLKKLDKLLWDAGTAATALEAAQYLLDL